MPNIIVWDVRGLKEFKGIMKNVERTPEMVSNAMMEWGNVAVKDFKNAAKNAYIQPFTGSLFGNGIRWEQSPKGQIGKLWMNAHGIYLDSMKPHFVNIKSTRTGLVKWGKQAINPEIRKVSKLIEEGKVKRHGIMVRPHPFIDTGFRRAYGKLDKIIDKNIKLK
jgi:hypothetical protein